MATTGLVSLRNLNLLDPAVNYTIKEEAIHDLGTRDYSESIIRDR